MERMKRLVQEIEKSPMLARVLPFAVFLGLTVGQGLFGSAGRYWMYLTKTTVGL